ncbi:protein D2-like isoform X2 [Lytechinus variegatus]|nr:protein D2-like isoform X2 [Lytechinus variegatus]XP_041455346.1 protein D2-like isoform X2 [Lytechinus variegatus]
MASKFVEHGVVPDVIDQEPNAIATVTWSTGVEANLGNILTPTVVKDPPTITWPTEESTLYTVIMTDPDAPSRADPKFREWRHWVVVNVPGIDVSKGLVYAPYIGSGPPKGTGLHRYVFLVYKQPGELQLQDPLLQRTIKDRGATKTREFVTKYNLGTPVAGNFYQAEWDDYCIQLMKEITQ